MIREIGTILSLAMIAGQASGTSGQAQTSSTAKASVQSMPKGQPNPSGQSRLSGEKHPNILFAIADDQSYPYASVYGTKGIQTPSFEEVAKKGILFTNAFVGAPQCLSLIHI